MTGDWIDTNLSPEQPPAKGVEFTVSISGILNFFKKRKKMKEQEEIEKIKQWTNERNENNDNHS